MKKIFAVAVAFAAAVVTFFAQAAITVNNPELCNTASTAIVLAVGESATFPAPTGEGYYLNLSDHRFLKQEGNVFTALEPGMAGVEVYSGPDMLVGTAMILIKPEVQSGGRVFVYDYTKSGVSWAATAWWDVDAKNYNSFPNGEKDIAFVPVIDAIDKFCIDSEYEVQDFFIGRLTRTWTDKKALRINGSQFSGDNPIGKLTIHGIKGKKYRPGKFMICSCAQDDVRWEFYISSYNKNDFWTLDASQNDLEIDLGGPSDVSYPFVGNDTEHAKQKRNSVKLFSDKYLSINIPEGRKVSVVNNSAHKGIFSGDDQGWAACDISLSSSNTVIGAGVFEIKTPGIVSFGKDFFCSFKGEIIDATMNHVTQLSSNRSGAMWNGSGNFNTDNATLTVAGYAMPVKDGIQLSDGVYTAGNTHGFGDPETQMGNGLPEGGVNLIGGTLQFLGYNKSITNKTGVANFYQGTVLGKRDYIARFESDSLTVGGGLSYIATPSDTSTNHPFTVINFGQLNHEDSGTLYLNDGRMVAKAAEVQNIRSYLKLDGFANHYAGNTTDFLPEEDIFPIVPWMLGRTREAGWNDFNSIWWASVDENNMVCYTGARTTYQSLNAVPYTNRNAVCYGPGNNISLKLDADKVVNSLMLLNRVTESDLGASRTLTISSGGLTMNGDPCRFGNPGGGTANGTIVFPERAYVWSFSENSDPSKYVAIWSQVVAPKGFVFTGPRFLELGGDQSGIEKDITINCGTLKLGNADNICTIDVPEINLMNAGSKLVVAKSGTLTRKTTINMYCPSGVPGKIEVPAGSDTEKCCKLYYDGETLPRGVYGPLDSDAQFPVWFITGGKLTVLSDDNAVGFKLHIR